MKFVKNPSYSHSPNTIVQFKKYIDNISVRDHTQYSHNLIDTIISAVKLGKAIGLKQKHLLWLTDQIFKYKPALSIVENKYIDLLELFHMNEDIIMPLNSYKTIIELEKDIDRIPGNMLISHKTLDIFFEKDDWIIAMPHTARASIFLAKDTKWYTMRTRNINEFRGYVEDPQENNVLFYIMKINGNPRKNPYDKLSIGYINGKPKFDDYRRITVNAADKTINDMEFIETIGCGLSMMMLDAMDLKIKEIGGIHPAKKRIIKAAQSLNLYLDEVELIDNKEELFEYKKRVASYPLSEEVGYALFAEGNTDIITTLALNSSISKRLIKDIIDYGPENSRYSLSLNPNLTQENILELTKHIDPKMLYVLAHHKNLPISVMIKIIKDQSKTNDNYFAVLHLASSAYIPEEIMELLTESPFMQVWKTLLKNPNVTSKIQKIIENKLRNYSE